MKDRLPVIPFDPTSAEERVQKLLRVVNETPALFGLALDELKGDVARINYQANDPAMNEVQKAAVEKDETLLWVSDSASLPPGAGTIRINQEPGQRHYSVIIDQEGMRRQELVLELDHGARLGTSAKYVSEADVLSFLQSEGGAPVKVARILKKFALTNGSANTILKVLCAKGEAVKPERGQYAAVMTKADQQ